MLFRPVRNDFTSPVPLPPMTYTSTLFTGINMALHQPPRALLFDVFGTCVDWRTTVTNALYVQAHASLNSATASLATSVRMKASSMSLEDWGVFAQQWRDSYKKFTASLASDPTLSWKTIDEHHHESLLQLLSQWGFEGLWLDDEVRAMSLVWHRLDPWPDSAAGIKALNKLFYTCTLSNGNLSLLADLRTYTSMDFTHLFSAEQFGSYKPSSKVYLGAVEKLGLKPQDCAMVAAHLGDLKAAKSHGLQAIYVERRLEEDWSPDDVKRAHDEGWVDLWIPSDEAGFVTVAEKLGIDDAADVQAKRPSSR
ncbi:HAD-like domain-containing protein [Clohesyomyces aquaticus]|uniref:HAD-like domain-containing protein n=1 Tax=Clohesyomyces aquaticus TaxID=1231657 RepID=A0A1Y1YTG1_9PLEO|nr:HAD-like domain-containing protein [Clohesyomyces aquaticus]